MDRETVAVYEARAAEWLARRQPGHLAAAADLARRALPALPRVDLGCGPGHHAAVLGEPVVALDAAWSMLALVPERAPAAWRVQADLEALPLRSRSLGAAWADKAYVHVPRARLPMALAHLHRALAVDAPVELSVLAGDHEGARTDDDFPGRFYASWSADDLTAVLTGAGFAVERATTTGEWLRVAARRARTLPDTVGPGLRVLVCGLNPSLVAADAGYGYAGPTNRFWPAALAAGLVTKARDPRHAVAADHVGMTDVVKRATPRAAELSRQEYRDGIERVRRVVATHQPRVVLFVGLEGWRQAVDRTATAGLQPEPFAGRPAYVMPSTSGLNARARLDDLVGHMEAALAVADGASTG